MHAGYRVKLIIIFLVFVALFLGYEYVPKPFDQDNSISSQQQFDKNLLDGVAILLREYKATNGRYPEPDRWIDSLSNFKSLGIGKEARFRDSWGHLLAYQVLDNEKIKVIAFGKDGKPVGAIRMLIFIGF